VKAVDEFTNPTGTIKKAAADLIAPSDTDEQKARKLYAAVQKLDNTAFSRKKSEAERKKEKLKEIRKAEDVWKQQSGSDDEIALLYVSLARAAGLKVRPAQVVRRDRAIFDTQYFSTRQLDDYLAILELDGKDVYLDPGQKMCPFGSLHWKHTLAGGMQLKGKEATTILTPATPYKNAVVQRFAELTIDASGKVGGVARFSMTGPDALHWRQLSLENDQDEVKKQFNESIQNELPEGVQAEFDQFQGLDDYNVNLVGMVKVSGNIGSATGKHFFLPGLFFETRAKHPFVAEDHRYTPIDVHYGKMEQDDVTYHLPAGFKIESVPQAANTSWPEHSLLKISARTSADSVNVTRAIAYNFVILDHGDYPALHDFYQKVATADQQQIVLARAPVTKGD
jgi:Transglutaminase-like superfamily